MEFVRFWREATRLVEAGPDGAAAGPIAETAAELERRFAAVLRVPPDAAGPVVRLASRDLAPRVREAFAAPHPGWPGARHHAVDVLIGARGGPAAVRRGDVRIVLGELHPGLNPFATLSAVTQHDDPARLQRSYARDVAWARIAPIPAVDFARSVLDGRLAPRDLHIDLGGTWASWRPPGQVLRAADLTVVATRGDEGDRLEVRTADGRVRKDPIEVLERSVKLAAAQEFRLLGGAAARTPRVEIDGVVVARAAWRFEGKDLAARARAGTLAAALLPLPPEEGRGDGVRFVFVRAPGEVKPFYVDLESEVYVDLLVRHARRAGDATLSIVEMLPTIEEAWLEDATGRRYTSELRLVAVDPEPWRPPGEGP